jgi:Asp-tRNA(Asn)/Glu-tRNA(Gln) amidotransferase A subunit family amidase
MGAFQLTEATIWSIQRAIRSGELSARRLVELYLERIEAYDRSGPNLNAVLTVNAHAVTDAEALDARFRETGTLVGPLHGVPILLKDSINTADIPTTYGSIAFKGYRPPDDATLVTLLREAGAVILAKTQLPDFATSWHGHSSVGGESLNPYDLDRDTGGSSSGTAAAVAANLGAVGIGGDTGGSIRVPASFNNLVGVRPTTRLISGTGIAAMVAFEDTAGPMTRTVRDAALLLDVVVGYDPTDPYTAVAVGNRPEVGYASGLREDALQDARVGVLRDVFGADTDPAKLEVNDVIGRALKNLASAGADVIDPVVIPGREDLIVAATLYAQRCKYDHTAFLHALEDSPVRSFDELYRSKQYHPALDFMDLIASGPENPEDDPDYFRGLHSRERFQREVLITMAAADLDAIVYPTVQIAAPGKADIHDGRWGTVTRAGVRGESFPVNTFIAPHATLPAISLPVGFTNGGLPVGLELLGRPYSEAHLLSVAYAYEQAFHPRRAPASTPPLPSES